MAGALLPLRRSRRRLNCPLWIRCSSSIPEIVIAAVSNRLNPSIGSMRNFTPRWSCSIRLFRYFDERSFVSAGSCPLERFHPDWNPSYVLAGVPKRPRITVRRPPVGRHRRYRCFGSEAKPTRRTCVTAAASGMPPDRDNAVRQRPLCFQILTCVAVTTTGIVTRAGGAFLGALRGGSASTTHRPGWRSASRACSRSLQPVRSAIFRTGRLLAPSMPVSSSARPALPPQP